MNETNTQFIEHIIFIMKNVLEAKYDNEPPENLGHTSIEQLMLDIVRYVRHLVNSFYDKSATFRWAVFSRFLELHPRYNLQVTFKVIAIIQVFS